MRRYLASFTDPKRLLTSAVLTGATVATYNVLNFFATSVIGNIYRSATSFVIPCDETCLDDNNRLAYDIAGWTTLMAMMGYAGYCAYQKAKPFIEIQQAMRPSQNPSAIDETNLRHIQEQFEKLSPEERAKLAEISKEFIQRMTARTPISSINPKPPEASASTFTQSLSGLKGAFTRNTDRSTEKRVSFRTPSDEMLDSALDELEASSSFPPKP